MNFNTQLIVGRKKKGISICGLARESGVPKSTIFNYENGVSPTVEKADELLRALDTYLVLGNDPYERAFERLGKFGTLFLDYKGCPRGATGRMCAPLEDEVLSMDVLTDVDGGRWIPVNEDALRELVERYKEMKAKSEES